MTVAEALDWAKQKFGSLRAAARQLADDPRSEIEVEKKRNELNSIQRGREVGAAKAAFYEERWGLPAGTIIPFRPLRKTRPNELLERVAQAEERVQTVDQRVQRIEAHLKRIEAALKSIQPNGR